MSYEWETELAPSGYNADDTLRWKVQHHLKKVWDEDPFHNDLTRPLLGTWKASVAWVTKIGDRKWKCSLINNESRTFRSLKAAKAYAVAIITLEN
jgi:hypothetical protein